MSRSEVTADLAIDVDGVSATLTGRGGRLLLAADDPVALWSAVTQIDLPADPGRVAASRALGRFADTLRNNGVRLDIAGPHGPLVSIGHGVRSGAGWLITGSSALRPGGVRASGPLIVSGLRSRRLTRRTVATALVFLVTLASAAVRRWRSSDDSV